MAPSVAVDAPSEPGESALDRARRLVREQGRQGAVARGRDYAAPVAAYKSSLTIAAAPTRHAPAEPDRGRERDRDRDCRQKDADRPPAPAAPASGAASDAAVTGSAAAPAAATAPAPVSADALARIRDLESRYGQGSSAGAVALSSGGAAGGLSTRGRDGEDVLQVGGRGWDV